MILDGRVISISGLNSDGKVITNDRVKKCWTPSPRRVHTIFTVTLKATGSGCPNFNICGHMHFHPPEQ